MIVKSVGCQVVNRIPDTVKGLFMSRIVHAENPSTVRNRHRRTIAEMLRRLSQKTAVDDESKDMAAMVVLLLHEIEEGVEQTAKAWEKRDYWIKSERFLRDWEWVKFTAADWEDVIRNDAFDLLPDLMADIFPRFTDIQIKTLTRNPSSWRGAYAKLMAQPPSKSPY